MEKINIKIELEKQIISAMINEPDSIPYIYQRVKENDFSENYKELFSHLLQMENISNMNTAGIVLELAKKHINQFDLVTINDLASLGFTSTSLIYNHTIEHFLDIVISIQIEKFLNTKLQKIRSDINGLDLASELKDEIEQLLERENHFIEEKSFSEDLTNILSEIESEMSNQSNSISLITKNFPSFNNSTGGLFPGNLCGIAGAYKSGKTTLGLNVIVDFVLQGIPAGFFTLELSLTEIRRKVLGMLSKISYESLRSPQKMSEKEKHSINSFYSRLNDFPLYISDSHITENEIRAKAKHWVNKFGLKVICVDYIGRLQSKKRFESREREMSYYSEFLKSLAKELNISIIVLAQLNRSGKNADPTATYLAESIGLARDCDFLFITYNPLEIGVKKTGEFVFNESHFVVKLDTTRHTKHKKSFILEMQQDQNFKEVATEYDNTYLLKSQKPEYSFIESEDIF